MRKINLQTLLLPRLSHMVALAIFSFFLVLTLYFVTTSGDDYQVAEKFIFRDDRIAASIGKVQRIRFRFWNGFESVGGDGGAAYYVFNAMTDKGEFVVEVHLRCVRGVWRVETTDIRAHDGTATRIAVD